MGTIRTFVAIDLPPVVKSIAQKQIRQLQRFTSDIRWVEIQNVHLTLKFLGNILDREVPEICRCVESAVAGHSIFDLGIRGVGAFPSPDRVRVLWLGIDDHSGALRDLQQGLDVALAGLGFQPEKRDFKAHLTLGRATEIPPRNQALATYLEEQEGRDFGSMDVDQIVVYSSFLEKGGPTYTPMHTIELSD